MNVDVTLGEYKLIDLLLDLHIENLESYDLQGVDQELKTDLAEAQSLKSKLRALS